MAETLTLTTYSREGKGSRLAIKLRKTGRVPGVVYGHKQAAVSVALDHKPLLEAVRHGVRVVEIKSDAGVENAQIVEVQWDHLGKEILHVDFKRVDKDERIHVHVPIELKGIAPGTNAGGVLDNPLHTLHVECLALAVPESIKVNISELQVGQAIHVKELKLPDNVKALDDADAVVVHVILKSDEPAPAPGEGTSAEPEVITKKKAEEAEAE
jgi:large subunit ribosomal protein L25